MYHPHTTNFVVLLKMVNEDKVFQLLVSLGAEYEDLCNHLLMTPELQSFISVFYTIQREKLKEK